MSKRNQVLIAGGGISGIFAALLLAQSTPKRDIVLVERAQTLGGLYSSFDYAEFGYFDHGPHLFYESCRPEVDRVIREVIPESEWIFLSGNQKDIAGVYHHNVLQTNSNYMDLRLVKEINLPTAIGDFFLNLAQSKVEGEPRSAGDYFLSQFGPQILNSVIEPVIRKLWGCASTELSPFVAKMVAMDRIILFDSDVMADLMKSDRIRSRLAYPDQVNLPAGWRTSSQRGLYPKSFGLVRFVNAAYEKLKRLGVTIITEGSIDTLDIRNGEVKGAKVSHSSGVCEYSSLEFVHWTAGMVPLERLLGADATTSQSLRTRKVVFVNALLKDAPTMADNYYVYCFEHGFNTHRVTNFTSYCPSAHRERGFPISIELHFDGQENIALDQMAPLAAAELLQMGLIKGTESILWISVGSGHYMWPIPTLESLERSRVLEAAMNRLRPKNLFTAGPSLHRDIFFLHDIISDAYNTLVHRID